MPQENVYVPGLAAGSVTTAPPEVRSFDTPKSFRSTFAMHPCPCPNVISIGTPAFASMIMGSKWPCETSTEILCTPPDETVDARGASDGMRAIGFMVAVDGGTVFCATGGMVVQAATVSTAAM